MPRKRSQPAKRWAYDPPPKGLAKEQRAAFAAALKRGEAAERAIAIERIEQAVWLARCDVAKNADARHSITEKADVEIRAIEALRHDLADALENMSDEAQGMLGWLGQPGAAADALLVQLVDFERTTQGALRARSLIRRAEKRPGGSPNITAQKLVERLKPIWLEHSGRTCSKSAAGPWAAFIGLAFAAAGIKADPASAARRYARE